MNALVLSSLIGDALALGPHWIYDADVLRKEFPEGLHNYENPRNSYHPGKQAGDFTHYGDQTLCLLRSLAARGAGWTVDDWREDWCEFWKTSTSYRDHATRETLAHFEAGTTQPSDSGELGGAARIAPLCDLVPPGAVERRVILAREATAMTHGDPAVWDAAELLARAVANLEQGASMEEALDEAAATGYEALDVTGLLEQAREWAEQAQDPSLEAVRPSAESLGLACSLDQALPLSLGIALRFENDPVRGLETNVLLGGDSAARGLVIGLLLGARHGEAVWPAAWRDGLRAGKEIRSLQGQLASGK